MARIRIPKNAGHFKVSFSMVGAYIVTNGKSGGSRIHIPCKSEEQAEKLCKELNEKERPCEIWI